MDGRNDGTTDEARGEEPLGVYAEEELASLFDAAVQGLDEAGRLEFRDYVVRNADMPAPEVDAVPTAPSAPSARPPHARGHEDRGRGSEAAVQAAWTKSIAALVYAKVPPDEVCRPMSLGIVHGFGTGSGRVADALGTTPYNPKADGRKNLCARLSLDETFARTFKETDTPGKLSDCLRTLLLDGNGVVLVASDTQVPPAVAANASWTFTLDDVRQRLSIAIHLLRAAGRGLDLDDGSRAEDAVAALPVPLPPDRSGAVLGWLRTVASAGRVRGADLATLVRFGSQPIASSPPDAPGPERLSDVRGLSPALSRRLAVIAERISGPMDEAAGYVFEGPTGTGKTMLARLLAKRSGRYFVSTSVTDWQGAGYLQDMMASMRRAFEEARRNAPSVMFLDELDSIGRRGTGDRNDQFWTLMINAFLEHLQGLAGRGDVVVIGATNNIHLIDPAVLRAGRFGEVIHVGNPDRAGRAEILRSLLPESLRGVDMLALADRTGDCSPALLRSLANEVALLAAGGVATGAHLDAALTELGRRSLAGYDPVRLRPMIAVGLCAQAVLAHAAYGEAVRIDGISVQPGLSDLGRVSMTHAAGAFPTETVLDLTRLLHMQAAAGEGRRAAAAALAGTGDTAALEMFSHLTASEDARCQATARMIARSGIAGFLSQSDGGAEVERAAQAILTQARREVRAIVRRASVAIVETAAMLGRTGWLDAGQAVRLLGLREAPPAAPSESAVTVH